MKKIIFLALTTLFSSPSAYGMQQEPETNITKKTTQISTFLHENKRETAIFLVIAAKIEHLVKTKPENNVFINNLLIALFEDIKRCKSEEEQQKLFDIFNGSLDEF